MTTDLKTMNSFEFKLGIEVLAERSTLGKKWGKLGLLCNQASIDRFFNHSIDMIWSLFPSQLTALFGPQHGIYGIVQDNMIETGHSSHPQYQLPIYSLYSEVREPTEAMLSGIDTLIIDLQLVGCRVYTFKWTIAACLRAAKKWGKKVVILDRPNPLGGVFLEGPVLNNDAHSFVGEYPLPMRHGLTTAEAAILFNQTINAELEIVAMENYSPDSIFSDLNRPWVMTSPNLPHFHAVSVYPGTVLLEGTNISEGRGTSLPFQLVGAPYLKSAAEFKSRVLSYYRDDESFYLRPVEFMPTYNKWAFKACKGVQIHVKDPKKIRSFALTLAIIKAAIDLGGDEFCWKEPPYEYDFKNLPIKLILGDLCADRYFRDSAFSVQNELWQNGISHYIKQVKDLLLYPRNMFS